LCLGPTPNLKEYKKNLKSLVLVLEGKKNSVLNSLKKQMQNFSADNEFEKAAKIRDKINGLQKVMSHSKVIENERINDWHSTQLILQGLLGSNKEISRIECYDISNIQGQLATGSMVVFINGQPAKNQYKKFKIKTGNTPNDIAMLKEIIERRLIHKEWRYPEIMLIDGGIAQLNIATKTKKNKNIKIISLAKKNKDLYIEGRKNFIPLKSLPKEIYNLIVHLDDEAHRFAITYHKKLRKDSLLT
jgi:excinuclease ABC subunit C